MIAEVAARLRENVQRVIVGRSEVVDLAMAAILCEGHILIEDVPGIGKTTLAKSIAVSLGCTFSRIQHTPDLLPSDITGVSVFDQKTQTFLFRPGPVMSQIVLADEINRATPRTQSAMLEAMQERQVTVDGTTYALPRPFLVLATQNPIELEGTFPLPEAQIDRFLVKLTIGYPTPEEEHSLLLRFAREDPLESLEAVTSPKELDGLRREMMSVRVEESVRGYIVDVVRATRDHPDVELGASPRGTLMLYKCAQALAAIRGRTYVLPDDVKRLVPYVLAHRILISPATRLRGRHLADVLMDVVETVPVPVEKL
jgi:MoxR-like ATPase